MALQTAPKDARWTAVLARDARADGRFVFAVTSTRIYCRPSCPARRPRPDRVRFFAVPAEAEQAGFRACRRCRPRDARPGPAWVWEACRLLAEAEDRITLEALGARLGVSPHHLQRTFTRVVGVSPRAFAAARRVQHLKRQLRKGDPVTTSIYDAGFGSASRVYEQSDRALGMTPATYRRGGRGMRIAWDVVPSDLGRMLVAATERGLAAVSLGDDDARLEDGLRAEYPHADLSHDPAAVRPWAERVRAAGRGTPQDLPLDVQATAFQSRVWQELQTIPRGETRSYSEVARAIGSPDAARAVARACASNRVALVVPCHRVVPQDASLGGYRWGVERKAALLTREQEPARRR